MFSEGQLLISTGFGEQIFEDELRFPDHLLANAAWFDRLIDELAGLAIKLRAKGTVPPLTALFKRLAVPQQDQPVIRESFAVLCRLYDAGRNHIWSYYIRNLVRPVWLARPENRVDVLVGNPPWLVYRNMPGDMQKVFQQMSASRGLWRGRSVATHQDLSALFVTRAVEQYLKNEGSFAFVLPNAALDRGYYQGFRSGQYADPAELTTVSFTGSWDLRRIRPHFFPRAASVVFGTRTPGQPRALPSATNRWSGAIPRTAHTWEEVKPYLKREDATLVISDDDAEDASPYGDRFSQGANIVPRLLFFVEPQPAGPLGVGAGRRAVRSATSSYEKPPWKKLPRLSEVVETEFVRPVLLGENLLPYRVLPARQAVLPLEGQDLLDGENPRLDLYPGLAGWWRQAEQVWNDHRRDQSLSLLGQLDYRGKLTDQLPVSPLRVIYPASAMHVCAAITDQRNAVAEHGLYWGTVSNHDEGYYLCAIFNCPEFTLFVRPLMPYGKDERHIDKNPWKLPIPAYDPANLTHRRLSELGRQEAETVAALDLNEHGNFISLRQLVRRELASREAAREISDIVTEMLG